MTGAAASAASPYGFATLHQGYPHWGPAGRVIAGAYGTWDLTYEVGPAGIATGGRIQVFTDSDTDWGAAQLDDPTGAEYLTIAAPPEARLAALVDHNRRVVLTVHGRGLQPGRPREWALTFRHNFGGE